jgi:hypothetical protein
VAEAQKLANSELGAIYVIGDKAGGEVLVSEGQLTRSLITATPIPKTVALSGLLLKEDGDHLLLETGGKIVLNDSRSAIFTSAELETGTDFGFGRNLANRVEVATYPRKVDASATTVLFTLQNEFTIAAGATKTGYLCRYRDPSGGASYVNGRDMVTPVSGTDYTAGSASGLTDKNAKLTVAATFGTEAVSFDLTNTDGATIYVTKLQVRGKGIYIYDPVRIVYNNSTSQAIHGVHTMNIDMRYQSDPAVGEVFADTVLDREANPDWTCDKAVILANKSGLTMYGFLRLEPGTRMTLSEEVTGVDRDFFVQGYSAEIVNAKFVRWFPVLQWAGTSSGLWILGTSTLGANTTLG